MNASNSALDASRFAQVASDTRNNTARAGSSAGGGGARVRHDSLVLCICASFMVYVFISLFLRRFHRPVEWLFHVFE